MFRRKTLAGVHFSDLRKVEAYNQSQDMFRNAARLGVASLVFAGSSVFCFSKFFSSLKTSEPLITSEIKDYYSNAVALRYIEGGLSNLSENSSGRRILEESLRNINVQNSDLESSWLVFQEQSKKREQEINAKEPYLLGTLGAGVFSLVSGIGSLHSFVLAARRRRYFHRGYEY